MRSALIYLVDSVRSQFVARGIVASVAVGWRAHAKTAAGAARVVFEPSEDGRGGRLLQPGQAGKRDLGSGLRARALADWERAVTVYCWAIDVACPNDQRAQIETVETLLENVVRAVQTCQAANVKWGAVSWPVSPVERVAGAEVSAAFVLTSPLYDWEIETGFPETVAVEKGFKR